MTTLATLRADQQEGERRKDAAHARLAAHRHAYIRRARRALLTYALAAGTVSADDVAELIGPTPDGIDPRYLGTVPGPLARAGLIRHVGYDRSCRPSRHASIISTWELADRDAAMAWLNAHPDPPEPEPDDVGAPCLAPPTPTSHTLST